MRTPATSFLMFAAMVAASPATAQVVEQRPFFTKSEAILGGAPSALAAITAQQGGARLISAVSPAYLAPAVAARPIRQPASPDRPDVFNSVALSVGKSSLDGRWDRVASAGIGGAAEAAARALRGQDIYAKLEAVNRFVNARVRFTDDRVQFGVADRWLSPMETLARGRGDCEDFALAKRAMLRSAGVSENDLYLVVLKDLSRRADHAVLVVRANGRFLVLDNGTDRILDSSDISDYRPILTFAAAGRTYTHGYRRDVPAMQNYAANRVQAPVALAQARIEPAVGTADLPAVLRDSVSLVPATVSL